MSSFSAPSSPSADELRKKIDDRQFQIVTLDYRAPNFDQVQEKLRSEVQDLEAQLKMKSAQQENKQPYGGSSLPVSPWVTHPLQNVAVRNQQPSRPHTSQSNAPLAAGFGNYAQSQHNGFGGHFASDVPVFGQPQTFSKGTWSFSPLHNTPNTPAMDSGRLPGSNSSTDSSPEDISATSTPPLPAPPNFGRKRQRESLNLPPTGTRHGSKSMRTTPSPAPTGSVTPASEDSFDYADDSDFLRLIGGNPREDMRGMREEQKAIEKQLEQERRDREIAMSLYDEYQRELNGRPSSAASSAHTFGGAAESSQASSQTIDPSGGFRLPDPLPTAGPSSLSGSRNSTYVEPGSSRHTYGNAYGLKQEQIKPVKPAASKPSFNASNFIDLGSDSDSDPVVNYGSDLVEIDSSSFYPSARKNKPASFSPYGQDLINTNGSAGASPWMDLTGVSLTNQSVSAGNSALNSGLTGYGGTSVYNASSRLPVPGNNWTTTYDRVRDGLTTAARGFGSAVNNLLDSQISTYQGVGNHFGNTTYPGVDVPGSARNPTLLGFSPTQDPYADQQQRRVQDLYNANPFDPSDPGNAYQQYIDHINSLSTDSGTSVAALKSLLENIRPDEELDPDPRTRIGTPEGMSAAATLYEHQKLGLKWMINMEEGSNKGGILADDMGLGKTIQAIALMVKQRSTDLGRKTTLIVAPVALLRQWESEISLKVKPDRQHRLVTYMYHSQKGKNITWEALKRYDVVLTTYGTLAAEYNRKQVIDIQRRMNPNWTPTTPADRLPLLGDECKWFRVILDEAQSIKNKTTKSAKAVFELQALTRFCMSGTPMMNNVGELFSLIHFLRIKPYCEYEKFNVHFIRPLKGTSATSKEQAMRKLQALLKAVLLRRTKKSIIDGHAILTLPERTTEIQHAVFSEDEQTFYQALETKTQLKFSKYLKQGTVGRNYSNVLVLLLRLRQACCHPHLIKDFGISAGGTGDVSVEDMIALAGSLSIDVVNRIKEAGAIECPICMDLAENATIFTPCGHSTCSECFTRIQEPSHDDEGGEGRSIKCPNCRGKVDPKKVTNYDSFKKVHMGETSDTQNAEDVDPQAEIETESESEDDSDDDGSSLDGFVVDDDIFDNETGDEGNEATENGYRKGTNPFDRSQSSKGKKKKHSSKGKGKEKEPNKSRKTLAQLKLESKKSTAARKKYLRRLEQDWETSGKIEKVMELLQATEDREEGKKTIIFSQFTSLLDLLEIPINRKDWNYRRYDGSMSASHRNDAVVDFNKLNSCKIMLVSLKAGNSGLNLTAASQVIILDPFWNPYIEEQAIDRAHRIGQRRPVQVHRILVPSTVEDRIIALQEKKRELIEGALDENASTTIGRLGERELAFLFGVPT
ncbi:hypothetical protein MMC30_004165 [Trapelia coarctata]|nr:hypothetical protein [Trapelia coarctata]